MSTPVRITAGNAVLRSLPALELAALLPLLELRHLGVRTSLIDPGERISHIGFPLSAVASVITESENGNSVEVAMIGNDGVVGADVFLGVWHGSQS